MPLVYFISDGEKAEIFRKDADHPEDAEPMTISDAHFACLFH